MKGRQSLKPTGPSISKAFPVVGSLLAGLVMVLAFALTVSGCATETNGARAGGGRGAPPEPPWPEVYEIISTLELEPDQLPAVRAVLEEAEEAREGLQAETMSQMDGGRPDPSAMSTMRDRMDEINEDVEDQLSELLTDEQMDDYRQLMQEAQQEQESMRSQVGGPGGRGGPGGGPPGGGGW